jgi:hypothetical protein
MFTISVLRMIDLPPATIAPVGEVIDGAQRFMVNPTQLTQRLYTVQVRGAIESGIYFVELCPPVGKKLQSAVLQIGDDIAHDANIRVEFVAPIFSDFVIQLVRVPAPAAADVPAAATPAKPGRGARARAKSRASR